MITKTLKIIDHSNIQSFSVKVTEQISDKYLLEFLRTSILNQQPSFTKNSKFYFQFIPSSLSYEIIVFDTNSQNILLEPSLFSSLCDTKGIELFITKEYFSLFEGKELLIYKKKIENILQEDIQTYIEQLYKIKIDKVTVLDEEKQNLIKDDFINNSLKHKFNFYALYTDNSFLIFLSFIFIVCIAFFFSLYVVYDKNDNTTTATNISINYEKGYKKLYLLYKQIDKKAINKTLEFISYCKDYHILIEKISYKNSKLYIELTDKSRKKILEIMRNYDKNIEISSIQFDNILKVYKVDIKLDVKK